MTTHSARSDVPADVKAGQAIYSAGILRLYDWYVLGLSNRLVWRCPTAKIEQLYREHLSGNHLDVGVGTGYFLDRCPFPERSPRIVLMDLNPTCLAAASERIARYEPQQVQCNILEPIQYDGPQFASISMNYVLHCLPGTLSQKSVVFDHLKSLLRPNGTLFGSTILGDGLPRNLMAQTLMSVYNRKGIFSNQDDSLQALQDALDRRFESCRVDTVGCVALFWGKVHGP